MSIAPTCATHQASDLRILVQGVGVRYRSSGERSLTLKEYFIRRFKGQLQTQEFWALRAVDLTIRSGEVVGIVGRNGAGKSTLLKAISRVIRPTTGRVIVRGRVSPLLDVGAGFHSELTGRENIYLNATLLGHTRREIDDRFDQIVAFSEIEQFLDAPVRTYSPGMVARLGFSIATAWIPDILILDEVLAVGDFAFQQKCATRIAEMQAHASAVLMVSHALHAVRQMCQRAVWIDHGTIQADGSADEVTARYEGR